MKNQIETIMQALAYNPGSPDFAVLKLTEQEELILDLQEQRFQNQLEAKQNRTRTRSKKTQITESLATMNQTDQKAYLQIKNLMARRQLKKLTRRSKRS